MCIFFEVLHTQPQVRAGGWNTCARFRVGFALLCSYAHGVSVSACAGLKSGCVGACECVCEYVMFRVRLKMYAYESVCACTCAWNIFCFMNW